MIQLLVATRNVHKTREFAEILGEGFDVADLSDDASLPLIEEIGGTFVENAILKAAGVSQHREGLIVADDSGLEVDALGGAPGIFSARYSGPEATAAANIDKVLREMAGIVERSARFHCALALARAGKLLQTFEGTVEGTIIDVPRGTGGFGYDAIFVPEGFEATFAELPATTKNQISHRARAIGKMRETLEANRV